MLVSRSFFRPSSLGGLLKPAFECASSTSTSAPASSENDSSSSDDAATKDKAGCDGDNRGSSSSSSRRHSQSCWRIRSYSGLSSLRLEDDLPMPALRRPDDVLVRVRAASVNPLDVQMTTGYGYPVLGVLRDLRKFANLDFAEDDGDDPDRDAEFPLTLGRDFSGEVVSCGANASSAFAPGEEVFGAVLPSDRHGSHARYVVTDKNLVAAKPKSLPHAQAAAVPYAGMTVYSAIQVTAGLMWETKSTAARSKKSALVLGASGGAGHLALQLLKAWGFRVVGVCSKDAAEMVAGLGADEVLDYRDELYRKQLSDQNGFDLILDCSGYNDPHLTRYLKPDWDSKYVTLSSPVLKDAGSKGLVFGAISSLTELIAPNVASGKAGAPYRWAYFMPLPGAMREFKTLAEESRLRPVVFKTFDFGEMDMAYQAVKDGSLRGKVVVQVKD